MLARLVQGTALRECAVFFLIASLVSTGVFFYLRNLLSRSSDAPVATERLLTFLVAYVQVTAVIGARQPDYQRPRAEMRVVCI